MIHLDHHLVIESTHAYAVENIRTKCVFGAVIATTADRQTNGVGTYDSDLHCRRTWDDLDPRDLKVSFTLYAPGSVCLPEHSNDLAIAGATIVLEVLEKHAPGIFEVKHPNDIIRIKDGRKLAGVLTQLCPLDQQGCIPVADSHGNIQNIKFNDILNGEVQMDGRFVPCVLSVGLNFFGHTPDVACLADSLDQHQTATLVKHQIFDRVAAAFSHIS